MQKKTKVAHAHSVSAIKKFIAAYIKTNIFLRNTIECLLLWVAKNERS
jgi:hypothetical protein